MEIALVARTDTGAWLRPFTAHSQRAKPATKRKASTDILALELPEAVRKDISRGRASVHDAVVLRQNISRAAAQKLTNEFLDAVEGDQKLEPCSLRIAFDFYGAGLLVWVESGSSRPTDKQWFDAIRDRLNREYSEMGVSVSLAYFTEKDEMPFPPEYVPEAKVVLIDPKTRRPKRAR